MADARVRRPGLSRLEPTWYPADVRERIREFGMDTIMAYRTTSRKKPVWLRRDSQDSKKSAEGLFVRAEQPTAIEPARIAEKVAHPVPVYCVPDPGNESTYVCRLMALRNDSPDSVKFDWDVPFAECKGPGHQQLAEGLAKRVQDLYRPGVEFIAADVEHWLVHGGEQPLPVFTHQYLTQSPKKRGRPSLKGSTDGKAKVSRASIGSDVRTEILNRQGKEENRASLPGMGPTTAPPAQASLLPGANGVEQSNGKNPPAKRQLFGTPSDDETETSSELSGGIGNGHAPSKGGAAVSSSSSGPSTSSSSSSEDTSSSSDTDRPAATEDAPSPAAMEKARVSDGRTTTDSSDEDSDSSSSSSSEDESQDASPPLVRPEPEKSERPPLSDGPAVNKDESSTESDSSSSSDDDDHKGASSSAGGFSDQGKEPSSLAVHAPASRENARTQAEPMLRDASSLVACCHMAIAGLLNPDMVFGGNAWTRERLVDSLDAIKQQLLENLELYAPLE